MLDGLLESESAAKCSACGTRFTNSACQHAGFREIYAFM